MGYEPEEQGSGREYGAGKDSGGGKGSREGEREKTDGIAYQNYDIANKVLAEKLRGKSFDVYGLHLGRVRQALPVHFPAVIANEMRTDAVFEMEDDSVTLVDYESERKKGNILKYGHYMIRFVERCVKAGQPIPQLHMVVIYGGDIKRKNVRTEYDWNGLRLRIEPAFLSEMDAPGIWEDLRGKVARKEALSDEDMMRFIILPLSWPTRERKRESVSETVALAAEIQDDEAAKFILSGLMVFADKIIDEAMREKIGGLIRMTQIGRMFWEERQQAVAEASRKAEAEGKAEAVVKLIEQIAQSTSSTLEEVCRQAGMTLNDYIEARSYLKQSPTIP